MKDGIIKVDSTDGIKLGFTSDKFEKVSYLWKDGNRIIISLIESRIKNKGYFSNLLNKIASSGFDIAVPNPSKKMAAILEARGFKPDFDEETELYVNY